MKIIRNPWLQPCFKELSDRRTLRGAFKPSVSVPDAPKHVLYYQADETVIPPADIGVRTARCVTGRFAVTLSDERQHIDVCDMFWNQGAFTCSDIISVGISRCFQTRQYQMLLSIQAVLRLFPCSFKQTV